MSVVRITSSELGRIIRNELKKMLNEQSEFDSMSGNHSGEELISAEELLQMRAENKKILTNKKKIIMEQSKEVQSLLDKAMNDNVNFNITEANSIRKILTKINEAIENNTDKSSIEFEIEHPAYFSSSTFLAVLSTYGGTDDIKAQARFLTEREYNIFKQKLEDYFKRLLNEKGYEVTFFNVSAERKSNSGAISFDVLRYNVGQYPSADLYLDEKGAALYGNYNPKDKRLATTLGDERPGYYKYDVSFKVRMYFRIKRQVIEKAVRSYPSLASIFGFGRK